MTTVKLLRRIPVFRGLLRSSAACPPAPAVARSLCFLRPPHALRYFSTPSAADQELLRILKEEIDHERQTDAVSQREAKQPPKPFTLKDQPGAQEVFLYRSYNKEDITISCLFQVQPYPEPNEEEDESEGAPSQLVQMNVKIAKGGDDPFLEIRCLTYGEEPVIEHVVYKEVATGVKDLPYEGPQFEDLDDSVQKGFSKFLKARGIDANLGSYLLTYMYHKEQREYSRWLQNVETFLAK